MRLLQLHTDFIEYQPIKEELKDAEKNIDKTNRRLENLVVVFVSVETRDNKKTIQNAVDEIKNYAQMIKSDRLLIYPYSHLSSDLSSPKHAFEIIKELETIPKIQTVHHIMVLICMVFTQGRHKLEILITIYLIIILTKVLKYFQIMV